MILKLICGERAVPHGDAPASEKAVLALCMGCFSYAFTQWLIVEFVEDGNLP